MFYTITDLEAYLAGLLEVPQEDISGYDDSLLDFGLDSVQIMAFAQVLQESGINIPFIQLAESVTLSSWWSLILHHRSGE